MPVKYGYHQFQERPSVFELLIWVYVLIENRFVKMTRVLNVKTVGLANIIIIAKIVIIA